MKILYLYYFLFYSLIIAVRNPNYSEQLHKIGDSEFPSNPLNDRAKGYILDGKIKTTISNYGNFIDWQQWPAGLWGKYAYLPHVGFIAGIPGNKNSANFLWNVTYSNDGINYWTSSEAYQHWHESLNTNYVGIAYNLINDKGELCKLINDFENNTIDISEKCIYSINHLTEKIELYLNIDLSNPNRSDA